ncbi:unnamed protein product [Cylicocyclus nassatus]|uniref:Ionotropic receptor n=1 Tax=Cylicocyclus nassatus TaxID=53992 RepID=A0AA36GT51_CYLNA|nr:unnamed protein product [Cylicocyclus nassatus]
MLLFEILALCTILQIIVQRTISKKIIAYTSEVEDEEGLAIYQHLTVSQTYHSQSHNMHDIIVKHIVITNTTSSNQRNASKNQIFLIPTTTVFYNVILDILPSLNLSTNASVLFDSAYGNMERTRAFFGMLPVFLNFVEIQSSLNSLQKQLQDVAAFERVIIVAKTTTTAVMVAREDIKPFQCEECLVDLLWIRPYATGIPNMHNLREFLVNRETGLKLNYSFRSWEELDVAFYFDVMDFVFEVFNKTLNHISYSCSSSPTETFFVFDDALVELTRPEYGAFKQLNASTFYQDVRAKVFRIERSSSTKETYSKQIASWTVANKVELLYGSFDVDIKTIRTYRIVTALQSPFVQLSGDPEKPYEGLCIDLIDMIREELNFTYTIYEVEDGIYGSIEQDGRWNGLIGDLVSGSADIALAALSATAERGLAVDFTLPYYKPVGIAILMKKPDVSYSMFEFTEVLEWQVWLSIAVAYLLASITLRLFDKLSPYSNTNKRERKMQ